MKVTVRIADKTQPESKMWKEYDLTLDTTNPEHRARLESFGAKAPFQSLYVLTLTVK